MKLVSLIGCAALAGVALFTIPADATTVIATEVFQFTSDHCDNGGGCGIASQPNGSGGTVTVNQNSDGTLSFDVSLANGNQFVQTGGTNGFAGAFAFNLSSPSITYNSLTPDAFTAVNTSSDVDYLQ